jgi:hypothetical protein
MEPPDVSIRFFVDLGKTGKFDFYSLPGDIVVYVDERREPELDHLPDWESSDPRGANEGQEGLVSSFRGHGAFWQRLETRRYPPLFLLTIPKGVEDFECPQLEFCEVEGRVIDGKGVPIPNVEVAGLPNRTTETDQHGRFHRRLDTDTYSLGFNRDGLKAIQRPDGVYEAVLVPGKLPKYEAKIIEWSVKRFPVGKIPDIVLPLRGGEKEGSGGK